MAATVCEDEQQKQQEQQAAEPASLEAQVQELLHMNAQWQQAHHHLSQEVDLLRHRTYEFDQLKAEVLQLRSGRYELNRLQEQLREAELAMQEAQLEASQLKEASDSERSTILRLQNAIESLRDSGESRCEDLEAQLLESQREVSGLRRELEGQKKQVEELRSTQQASKDVLELGEQHQKENAALKEELAAALQEKQHLSGIVERCVEKLEKESRERPHLVDKRMATQMLAAYLEQRENPREQQEILNKMADLLGFTAAEREQVGLTQRRKRLDPEAEEPSDFSDLTDRFVEFLHEESEGV
mmetsp:Transcript_24118/g.55696  ORF Transcript_24118/g.55696 Transcript_24118/m.55696 type:complete len:301 (-) Transcript_24118:90-992(-)